MKQIPTGSVDAVITDPPYGIGIGGNGRLGGNGMVYFKQYEPVAWDDVGLTAEQLAEMKRLSTAVICFGFEHLANVLGKAASVIVWDKKCKNGWDDNFSDCEIAWTNIDKPTRIFRHMWMGALRDSEHTADIRVHPTQKPLALMRWIIEKYTQIDATILDPFMGSGTTGVACIQTGRNFIGIEIDEGYFKIAERRITEAQLQVRMAI